MGTGTASQNRARVGRSIATPTPPLRAVSGSGPGTVGGATLTPVDGLNRRSGRRRHREAADPAPRVSVGAEAASLRPALGALEQAFARFNAALFGGALGPAVIDTPPRGRRQSWGWYRPAGYDGGEDTLAEVSVAAEGLRRPPAETLLALLVQMVRHRNAEAGVKDCASRGRRLNKRFAKAAKTAGLEPPKRPDKRTGYAAVTLGERAASEVGTLAPTLAAACALARVPEPPVGAPGLVPYECGCAGEPKVWTYKRHFDRTECPGCRERYRRAKRGGDAGDAAAATDADAVREQEQ